MFSWINNLFNTKTDDNYSLMHFKRNQVVPQEATEYSKIAITNKPNGYNSVESSYENNTVDFGKKLSYSEPIVIQSVVDFTNIIHVKRRDDIRRD